MKQIRLLTSTGNRLLTSAVMVALFTPAFIPTIAIGQSANLDQIRNGAATAPITPATWVNGNAGKTNAHYAEGYSIPYRAYVTGITAGSHVLIIEWDTKDQNGHAIDYITHYDNMDNPDGSHMTTFGHAAEVVDPTIGINNLGSPTTFDIIEPSSSGSEVAGQPTASFNALAAAKRRMTIWGGTINSLVYDFQEAPDATTGSTQTRLTINFTSTGTHALIAWGGHIAAEYDWGAGRGATGVNGSPYHTRIISIDGKPGNQDRSLKADAVVIPPPLCGISAAQTACPETSSLTFTAEGSSTGLNISYQWSINAGNTAGAVISGSSTGYSVTIVPAGTDFVAGGTFNLSLQVNKTGAESTTCNRSPAGTIENTVVNATANPTTIDITSATPATTLTASMDAASTDANNDNYDFAWSIVGSANGSLTNANQRIATYTAVALDAGSSITFQVIATQKDDGNPLTAECSDAATVQVSVNSVGPCDVSPQSQVCQGVTNTHTGSPNPIPANATYLWSLEAYGGGGTTTATLSGTNGGTSIDVVANESYRIVLTQTYANTALNTSCWEDVTVIPTPSVSANYVAPTCSQSTFKVTVPSPTIGFQYSISQPGNSNVYQPITPTAQDPLVEFTGLTPGDGYIVTVNNQGCTATDACATNPTPITSSNRETKPVTEETVLRNPETVRIEMESQTRASARPNPYTDRLRFSVMSGVSGKGSLELYNMIGQKVATVYEGYVQSGKEMIFDYMVPRQSRTNMIYIFRVGDQKVSGKLIGLSK